MPLPEGLAKLGLGLLALVAVVYIVPILVFGFFWLLSLLASIA